MAHSTRSLGTPKATHKQSMKGGTQDMRQPVHEAQHTHLVPAVLRRPRRVSSVMVGLQQTAQSGYLA